MNNILLVDDNYYFLMALSMQLCLYLKNCNVLTAANGRKALEIMKSMPVDCVVTDLEMPSMNGYELVESVKKSNPAVPVYVMTAADRQETEKRLASLGVSRCFAKPFDFKRMGDMIASALHIRA